MTKKILCLHGYAMNQAWFHEWLSPIQQALVDKAELVIPQGGIAAPETEVRAMVDMFQVAMPEDKIGVGKNWCWYRATVDKPPVYLYLDKTLNQLTRLYETDGPFGGVLGWSQGAVVAVILAALQARDSKYDFGLRWMVLCGGFLPGDEKLKKMFSETLPYPSLHVVGQKEPEVMIRRCQKLHAAFAGADWLDTPAGHVMPVKYPDCMLKIADWMATKCVEL